MMTKLTRWPCGRYSSDASGSSQLQRLWRLPPQDFGRKTPFLTHFLLSSIMDKLCFKNNFVVRNFVVRKNRNTAPQVKDF